MAREHAVLCPFTDIRWIGPSGRRDDDTARAGLQVIEIAVREADCDLLRRSEVARLANPAGVAAVEYDRQPLGLDCPEYLAKFGPRDRRARQVVIPRVDHFDRQEVLALVRPLSDVPAVPREIEEDGRVGVTSPLERLEPGADLLPRCVLFEEDRHVLRVIPAERGIGKCRGQVLGILDLGEFADIRIVGDPDNQGMGVFEHRHWTLRYFSGFIEGFLLAPGVPVVFSSGLASWSLKEESGGISLSICRRPFPPF